MQNNYLIFLVMSLFICCESNHKVEQKPVSTISVKRTKQQVHVYKVSSPIGNLVDSNVRTTQSVDYSSTVHHSYCSSSNSGMDYLYYYLLSGPNNSCYYTTSRTPITDYSSISWQRSSIPSALSSIRSSTGKVEDIEKEVTEKDGSKIVEEKNLEEQVEVEVPANEQTNAEQATTEQSATTEQVQGTSTATSTLQPEAVSVTPTTQTEPTTQSEPATESSIESSTESSSSSDGGSSGSDGGGGGSGD